MEYFNIEIPQIFFWNKNVLVHIKKKLTSSARDVLVKTLMLKNEIPTTHPFWYKVYKVFFNEVGTYYYLV